MALCLATGVTTGQNTSIHLDSTKLALQHASADPQARANVKVLQVAAETVVETLLTTPEGLLLLAGDKKRDDGAGDGTGGVEYEDEDGEEEEEENDDEDADETVDEEDPSLDQWKELNIEYEDEIEHAPLRPRRALKDVCDLVPTAPPPIAKKELAATATVTATDVAVVAAAVVTLMGLGFNPAMVAVAMVGATMSIMMVITTSIMMVPLLVAMVIMMMAMGIMMVPLLMAMVIMMVPLLVAMAAVVVAVTTIKFIMTVLSLVAMAVVAAVVAVAAKGHAVVVGLLKEHGTCVVCYAKPKNATIIHGDSGHGCCCLECATTLKERGDDCPICRASIDLVIKQYN